MSKTPRTNEMLKRYDTLEDGAAGFMLLRQSIEELETELAEARAEIERLSKRDGSAKHELVYDDGDNPFAREKLEHVDFGVADNNYVLESHLLNNTLEQIKAKDAMIERLRSTLACARPYVADSDSLSTKRMLDTVDAALAAAEGGEGK